MTFKLPPLPYKEDALEPHMTATTLSFHYGKHHQTYVDKLNELIKGTEFEKQSLEDIIKATAGKLDKLPIFNNAAQTWNHTFFWNCLTPKGGGDPKGSIKEKIEKDLGGMDKFREAFTQAALTQFGSGWAWLVLDPNGNLKIGKSSNADLPIVHNHTPILTCDVWEHAYYLDYQNRRPDFVAAFLEKLVNWEFAQKNLDEALKEIAA